MLNLMASCETSEGDLSETETLRILNTFAVDVMSIPNEEDLFWYVAQNVVGRLNFIDCVIYTANEDQTQLTQVAALGDKNPFGRNIANPLRIPFGQGITGRVAQTGEAIVIDDLASDASYIPDTQLARSEICVPMTFRNRIVGVIDSEHPNAKAFGEAELEVLTTVAAMTSAKLELLAESDRSHRRYHDLVRSHDQLTEETNARKALEKKLFEARKMEAIGRLTGGFAHDFNNLLMVVSGNLELLEMGDLSKDATTYLGDAQDAVKRGAKLIENMLAFSQRSLLSPEIVDLAAVCENSRTLSAPILPEETTVTVHTDSGLWPVLVDQGATENALLNLVINARDAMPDGGTIAICAQNRSLTLNDLKNQNLSLEPGKYVCLSVCDTGTGIPSERMHQVFDPFFTTKPAGSGTGLGLSMIVGFMQQTGGDVALTSTVGEGSTFSLYFPKHPKGSARPTLKSV